MAEDKDYDVTKTSASGGHTAQGQTIIDKLAQFKIGAQSLVQNEGTVPALSNGIPDYSPVERRGSRDSRRDGSLMRVGAQVG